MRGLPIDLPVPLRGQVNNVPRHKVPLDALLDGQNVFVDIDGLLRARFGYTPNLNAPGLGPIIGLGWWLNEDGSNQYIAVTPTDVAASPGSPPAWRKVTGATPLTGSVNDPVRIRPFFQNNFINMVICNNHDPLQFYNTGMAAIASLTPTLTAGGTSTAYTATTSPTFATYPVGTQFFVKFPVTNGSSPTLALNGLAAIPITYLNNGVITAIPSSYLSTSTVYNLSYDGTEFVIGTNLQAPIARDFAVVAGRLLAINITTAGSDNVVQATWTAAYDFTNWPALAFSNLVDTDDTLVSIQPLGDFSAVIYGRQSAWLVQAVAGALDPGAFQFTPIQNVTIGPCSPLAVIVAEGVHYYLGIDASIWLCDGSGAYHISQTVDPSVLADVDLSMMSQIHGFYHPYYRHNWWVFPSRAQSLGGPSAAAIYNLERQVFEPEQVFTQIMRASTLQGQATAATCDQLPFPCSNYPVPCSTFGAQNQLSIFLGSDSGVIYNFSSNSTNDNGLSIPYFAIPGLLSAGPSKDLLPESVDLFFDPSSAFELSEADFFDLPHPYASPDTPILVMPLDLADPSTWQLPKILPQINVYSRFMKLQFRGVSYTRAFAFAGGTVFVNTQERSSKNLNVSSGV